MQYLLRQTFILITVSVFAVFSSNAQCKGDFTVSTTEGDTVLNICLSTTDPAIAVVANIRGFPIMYVLTDGNDNVLNVTTNPKFDFTNAGPGVWRIYAATFKGRILQPVGQNIYTAKLTTFCWELSNNYVSIINGTSDPSTIQTSEGSVDTSFCAGDGIDDILIFEHTPTTANYAFVITDANGMILSVTQDSQNFDSVGQGTCLVYGLDYEGNLLAMAGMNINDLLADGCYRLSDNTIQVRRISADAGQVETVDGLTALTVCVGDNVADSVFFNNPGANTSANYAYIVTDENDTILAVTNGNVVDFEGAGLGICRVYGAAYAGSLHAMVGMSINDVTSSGNCLGITANFVEVNRTSPMEGRIETVDGDTIVNTCPGDSIADIVTVNTFNGGSPYIFIITDDQSVVLGVTPDSAIDLEGAGEGICFIYRSSYAGNLTIEVGDTLFQDPVSDGCYVFSDNAVQVNRVMPNAGSIMTTQGDTTLNLCVGDGTPDTFRFNSVFNANAPFVLVVTDADGIVLGIPNGNASIDFDDAGSGNCLVYGLSYHGDLWLEVGDSVTQDSIASACFDWSDNVVEVIRNNVDPGTITSQYGTLAFTCPGDGNADNIILTRINDADTSVVVVTDNSGLVLAITNGDTVDVEGAGEGTCLIWNLSFTGDLLFEVGDTLMGQDLSTACFKLSDPVFVQRQVPYSDTLSTSTGDTIVEYCTSDGLDDLLILNYPPVDEFPIAYIVTDTAGVILAFSLNDTINFEGIGAGLCRVYGVAYTGSLTVMVGENIGATDLSDDCYAISFNIIEVNRVQPEAGSISLEDGSTEIFICPGDTTTDVLRFVRDGGSNDPFTYIVTDDNNVILGLPDADSVDFNDAGIGICRIYGVSFSGNFIAEVGDSIPADPLSDDCFSLSNNFISVVRDTAEAGIVMTTDGDTLVNVITGDTLADIYELMAVGASSGQSRFVITDANDLVFAILGGSQVDLGMVPDGEYRVYHIVFTGNLVLTPGFNVTTDAISDDCFDVSDNFIRFIVSMNFNSEEHEIGKDIFSGPVDVDVYPNPASGTIYLNNYGESDLAIIHNSFGKLVKQLDLNGGEQAVQVNDLPAGLYLITTMVDNKPYGQKMIYIQ